MAECDWLTERFEDYRGQLRAVASGMLGSASGADEHVHEARLRLSGSDARSLESFRAWLTTFVAGLCLSTLRARRSRPEHPSEAEVPGLFLERQDGTECEREAPIADSVTVAVLAALRTLSPEQRLAFVLHDVFAVSPEQIAPTLECSTESAKQLLSDAGRRFRDQSRGRLGNGAGWEVM